MQNNFVVAVAITSLASASSFAQDVCGSHCESMCESKGAACNRPEPRFVSSPGVRPEKTRTKTVKLPVVVGTHDVSHPQHISLDLAQTAASNRAYEICQRTQDALRVRDTHATLLQDPCRETSSGEFICTWKAVFECLSSETNPAYVAWEQQERDRKAYLTALKAHQREKAKCLDGASASCLNGCMDKCEKGAARVKAHGTSSSPLPKRNVQPVVNPLNAQPRSSATPNGSAPNGNSKDGGTAATVAGAAAGAGGGATGLIAGAASLIDTGIAFGESLLLPGLALTGVVLSSVMLGVFAYVVSANIYSVIVGLDGNDLGWGIQPALKAKSLLRTLGGVGAVIGGLTVFAVAITFFIEPQALTDPGIVFGFAEANAEEQIYFQMLVWTLGTVLVGMPVVGLTGLVFSFWPVDDAKAVAHARVPTAERFAFGPVLTE